MPIPQGSKQSYFQRASRIPTLEEILRKLSGAKYPSIVDAKCGYWNVKLYQEPSYLTIFNSPFGRCRFLPMPFGLRMSQDVLQAKIDQTFEGCEGTIEIAGLWEVRQKRSTTDLFMGCWPDIEPLD